MPRHGITREKIATLSEIDWHREMLADLDRVNAFRAALSEAVHPGDVVLDIGTGTGLLALFAIQLGASRVYAIEQGDIVNVAEEVVARNGISREQIRFLKGHSSQVELPERVDLVVAELIGSFGLEESIIPVLSDARERFLKPGGRLLPSWLDLHVAPTEEGLTQGRWQRVLAAEHGLDFTPLSNLSQHRPIHMWADPAQLLADGVRVFRCDFRTCSAATVLEGDATIELTRSGLLCGWMGWFRAGYDQHSFLSTQPPIAGSSWENVLFPSGDPVPVERGQVATLKLRLDDPFWSWTVRVADHVREYSELHAMPETMLRPLTTAGVAKMGS
jgi:protein arginine N-methyltransferase 1